MTRLSSWSNFWWQMWLQKQKQTKKAVHFILFLLVLRSHSLKKKKDKQRLHFIYCGLERHQSVQFSMVTSQQQNQKDIPEKARMQFFKTSTAKGKQEQKKKKEKMCSCVHIRAARNNMLNPSKNETMVFLFIIRWLSFQNLLKMSWDER